MRSAAIIEWEAARDAGLIRPGPQILVVMSPRQWGIVTSCVQNAAYGMARAVRETRNRQVKTHILAGIKELLDIMRALERPQERR